MPVSISENKQQIVDAYKQHLGREPQQEEISNWVNHVNTHGGSIETIQQGLANHPLAKQKENIQPIKNAYTDYLGREASAGELAGWTDHASKHGLSSDQIIREIAVNPAAGDYRQGLRDDNQQLTTRNTELSDDLTQAETDRDTYMDERDTARTQRDTYLGERDTARNERDRYLGERDTARNERDRYLGERNYFETQSTRNYGLYQDALGDNERLEGELTEAQDRNTGIQSQLDKSNQRLEIYDRRATDASLSGLRGGASSGGSNQSSRYSGGSLASGSGTRSSASSYGSYGAGTYMSGQRGDGGYSVDRTVPAESGMMNNRGPVVARMNARNYQSSRPQSGGLASGGGSGYYASRFR